VRPAGSRPGSATRALLALAAGLALVGLLMVALPGPLYRIDWLDLGSAFATLRWGFRLGVAAVLLGLGIIALCTWRAWYRSLAAALVVVIVASAAVIPPLQLYLQARAVPPIHDITTDTERPPAFAALAEARAAAPNAVDYPGDSFARQQEQAYPGLDTVTLRQPPARVFAAARAAAEAMDWEIVAAEPAAGRIEAVATTAWFGFRDDVSIRIDPADGGSRIDIRSASRVGRSDLGANAARIRSFLERLEQAAT